LEDDKNVEPESQKRRLELYHKLDMEKALAKLRDELVLENKEALKRNEEQVETTCLSSTNYSWTGMQPTSQMRGW
jgi:hypothetical protein